MSATRSVGRYEVLRLLAAGGMGEVLLARHTGPAGFSKLVVLKRILRHLADDLGFIQMFVNEARTAAQLQHPNIVQVFDFGEHEGAYFLAMEYIDGASLRELHKRSREGGSLLPFEVSARVCAEALRGLHHAHTFVDEERRTRAIVHRDISPDNILVGRTGTVKVVDFGVAKPVDSATKTNTVKGKLPYLAPEQVTRGALDPRTDLYAMGITLFELTTGSRPFTGDSELELLQRIVQQPAPLATAVNPAVPAPLAEIIARALRKDPEERFASAAEMTRALEGYLATSPASSTPEDLGLRVNTLAGPPLRSGELVAPEPFTQGTVELEPVTVAPEPPPAANTVSLRAKKPSPARRIGALAGGGTLLVAVAVALLVGLRAPAPANGATSPGEPVSSGASAEPSQVTPSPPEPAASAREEASAVVPPPAATAPETQPEAKEEPRRPPRRLRNGTVRLLVRPWAEVFVDGRRVGITPMKPISLAPGKHTVVLENSQLQRSRELTVTVPAGKQVTVRENLFEG